MKCIPHYKKLKNEMNEVVSATNQLKLTALNGINNESER